MTSPGIAAQHGDHLWLDAAEQGDSFGLGLPIHHFEVVLHQFAEVEVQRFKGPGNGCTAPWDSV
jgi:hypothetical protein